MLKITLSTAFKICPTTPTLSGEYREPRHYRISRNRQNLLPSPQVRVAQVARNLVKSKIFPARVPQEMTVKILPGNGNSKRITIPREYHQILGDAVYVQIKLEAEGLIIKPQRMVDAPLFAE